MGDFMQVVRLLPATARSGGRRNRRIAIRDDVGVPLDGEVVLATTEHGQRFVSAVARGCLAAVQFHPERSGDDGLRLLSNFRSLVASAATAVPA